MIAQDRSYPHPVLTPFRDDVQPNVFTLTLSVEYDPDNYYLEVDIAHENPTLATLLREGRATYAVHVECRRNFYRHLHLVPRASRIAIRSSDLVGRVEVTAFLLATQTIDGYQMAGAHEDYGNTRFLIQKGHFLAVGETRTFDAYTDYDPLKHLSSILVVQRSETDTDGLMLVDTTGDRIVATLSQHDYEQYTNLRGDPMLASLLSNQVVVPVLLQALFEMATDRNEAIEEGMARRWYRSLDAKLTNMGVDLRGGTQTPLDALQKLLRSPLRRSLVGLAQATAEDDDQQ
jgi:hypothetical protein